MLINLPTYGKKKLLSKFICDVDQHETKEKQIKFFLSYRDPRNVKKFDGICVQNRR